MSASGASHPFQQRASQLMAQAATSGFPGYFSGAPSVSQVHNSPRLSSRVQTSAGSASSQGGLPRLSTSSGRTASQQAVTSSQSSDDSGHGTQTPCPILTLQCFICTKSWSYITQEHRAEVQEERAKHLKLCHDIIDEQYAGAQLHPILITEDDGVATLTDGRWLPFPQSTEALCRKLPKQITPTQTNLELDMMGLPLASKKPLELLHNRVDNSLSLKMFSKERLINHEKLRKRKLDLVHGPSTSSIILDESPEDLKSNSEAMESLINYVILSNYIDCMDKSPLALLQVGCLHDNSFHQSLCQSPVYDLFPHLFCV